MKVLHVTPSFYPARVYGGPTESIYRLCQGVARAGCEVRVLTTNANGKEEVLDVPVDREVPVEDRLSVRYCARWGPESVSASLLKHLLPAMAWADVAHLEAVYSFPTLPTLLAARGFGKPLVWSSRGALARWSGARRPRLKGLYDRMCRLCRGDRLAFHFTSAAEREAGLRRFPRAEGVVIPNGVESRAFPAHRSDGKTLRFLYLGRLDPIKGIENLLAACARFKARAERNWRLTIAGGGEARYTAQLQAQIHEAGLEGAVRMIGRVEGRDKEETFAEADVVVAPSHLENFCIVVAEALARGIPVIAGRGTPWQRLETEGCGLWVPNDPDGLAGAMERIGSMPLGAMGEKGRAWMQAEFSWDRIAAQMIRLYERMMREGGRA